MYLSRTGQNVPATYCLKPTFPSDASNTVRKFIGKSLNDLDMGTYQTKVVFKFDFNQKPYKITSKAGILF